VIPGASDTEAYGLNDKGDIVGKFLDRSGEHGFLLSRGEFTHINIPSATLTDAFGINDRGHIVGHLRDASGNDGFLLSGDEVTRIKVPGAVLTVALGINDQGEIVDTYTTVGGTFHGFLLTHGEFITIDVPGAPSTNAQSINNAGEIVGISRGAAERGFHSLTRPIRDDRCSRSLFHSSDWDQPQGRHRRSIHRQRWAAWVRD
jgi:uncharacterized membrane protein